MFSMLLLGVGSALASDTWVKDSDPGYSYPRPLGVSGPVTIGDTFGGMVTWGLPESTAPPPSPPTFPAAFDARVYWNGTSGRPNCSTMVTVQNQGGCGSCWAFGTSESFSDRVCVASNGAVDKIFSAQEATSCTGCMGKAKGSFNASCAYTGCNGGQTADAWRFFAEQGLVSRTCWPYGAPSPKVTCNASEMMNHTCADNEKWKLQFAKEGSVIGISTIDHMKQELMANGPISSQFKVFEDFFQYKSGVYNGCSPPSNQSRKLAGYHAIKIVGWGSTDIDPVLDYWTVQNSWGPGWGMSGYFNMVMDFTDQFGVNHSSCGIGTQAIVGQADVTRF